MKNITVIPGDGVGPEIMETAMRILQQAAKNAGSVLTCQYHAAGGAAIDQFGVPLPEATLQAARQADGILLGAVGGPAWDSVDSALRPEKAILGLRKELGLYANLRPIKISPALVGLSPLQPERLNNVDILIVRELNGGIYYGEKCEAQIVEGVEAAWDTERYSTREVDRIVRLAMQTAGKRRHKVTSVDKANVLASSRLWRKTADLAAADFKQIELQHLYVDNCAMQLVLNPGQFDVIVTSNLFGDILSDEAAVLAGSIGLMPSASIGDGPGLYEPIHGSAPDIAGQGIANPLGMILSVAMLLRYSLQLPAAADQIEQAVDKVLNAGYRTADLYTPGFTKVSTDKMGALIAEQLNCE